MMTGVVLVSGMAFMVWWPTLFEDKHGWQTSADMWGIFRAAHYVGWGFLGGVYDPSTGVNSPPGMEVLLAPVAMLSGHLGLTESFSPYFIPRPTAALLLEPVELLLASTVLFAVDALAGHLGLGRPRRICLCIATTVLVWPTAAVWGHAEDCLSLALAMYALIAALKGRWAACGWLFAFALVIQPFVVMVLPIVVAASPAGQRMLIVVRSFSLTALFVGAAFASDAANAYRALVLQPTPPTVNHPTPWISLAPRLFQAPPVVAQRAVITYRSGKFVEHVARGEFHSVALVSGGAGRAIETVLAVFIGLYVWRRPQSADRFVWLAAVCLGMRCLFEAVMLPYYLGSPLILLVAVTSLQSRWRFLAAGVIAVGLTAFAYSRLSPWVWWMPIVVGLVVIVLLARPAPTPARGRECSPIANSDAVRGGDRPGSSPFVMVGFGDEGVTGLSRLPITEWA